jgi:hypothetical protein
MKYVGGPKLRPKLVIRIRIHMGPAFNGLLDPDPEGEKSAKRKEEKLSLKTRKKRKLVFSTQSYFGQKNM